MTSLPLRIQPLEGEAWLGYVRRVATQYGVGHGPMMQDLLGMTHCNVEAGAAGVAVTRGSAQVLASYFRLSVEEVAQMHLEAALGPAWLSVTDEMRAQWDPFAVNTARAPKVPAAGPIWPGHYWVTCPSCLEERPGFIPAVWRIVWMPACRRHQRLLRVRRRREDKLADPELLQAQDQLQAWASSDLKEWSWRSELVEMSLRRTAAYGRVPSLDVPELLPGAVQAAAQPGYPYAHGLVQPEAHWRRRRRTPRRAEHLLRAPHVIAPPTPLEDLARHPGRLPRSMFPSELNDLLEEALGTLQDWDQSRMPAERAAAIAAAMTRYGCTLVEATPSDRYATDGPSNVHRRTFLVLCALEDAGRLETFWAACRDVAASLASEDVDYGARIDALSDQAFTEQFFAAADVPRPTAGAWLIDEWACTPSRTPWIRSLRIGSRTTAPPLSPDQHQHLQEVACRSLGAATPAA